MDRQKWEYKTHVIGGTRASVYEDVTYTDQSGMPAGMSEMLADFGEAGWELTSTIVVDEEKAMILILKRPKVD
jgi:hypothetical protein